MKINILFVISCLFGHTIFGIRPSLSDIVTLAQRIDEQDLRGKNYLPEIYVLDPEDYQKDGLVYQFNKSHTELSKLSKSPSSNSRSSQEKIVALKNSTHTLKTKIEITRKFFVTYQENQSCLYNFVNYYIGHDNSYASIASADQAIQGLENLLQKIEEHSPSQ